MTTHHNNFWSTLFVLPSSSSTLQLHAQHDSLPSSQNGWWGGSTGSSASDSRYDDLRFEPQQEHEKNLCEFFQVKNVVLTWLAVGVPNHCVYMITHVTLPPEMSRIATRSLLRYSQWISQRGCHVSILAFQRNQFSPGFSTSEKYTCYTHKTFIGVISMCLKQATLQ